MNILTPENTCFNMNMISKLVDDLQYCVLDYSNPNDVDFYFIPLIFLDTYPRPAADLQIGPYRVQVPLDWSIVISEKNLGNLEIIELKHLNDRPFEAFVLNPIKSYMPDFYEITIENLYPDITWNVPKLKYGHILAVPLETTDNPKCAFFVKDANRLPEQLDITKVFC